MERAKLVKIGIAAAVAVLAVVLVVLNLRGGNRVTRPAETTEIQPDPTSEDSGGGRLAPGADEG